MRENDVNQLANRALDMLKQQGYWLESMVIIRRLDLPQPRHDWFRQRVLERLAVNGVLEKKGTGRFRWRLKATSWDRDNPFRRQCDLTGTGVLQVIDDVTSEVVEDRTPWPARLEEDTVPEYEQMLEAVAGPEQAGWSQSQVEEMVKVKNRIRELERQVQEKNAILTSTNELVAGVLCKMHDLEAMARSAVKEVEIKVNGRTEAVIEGRPHPMLEKVLKLCMARINVLLIGPAGSGKSYLAGQVAQGMGLDFAFISCSAGMSEGQLLGRLLPLGKEGKFDYVESDFVRCYEKGGLFLFDEVDAADANTLIVLNTALANGHLSVPNRSGKTVAKKSKDFVCLAAGNTFGTGADRQYVGRGQLDEAFIDRFRMGQVVMGYDPALEAFVCPDQELRDRLVQYRRNAETGKVRRVISMRFMKDAFVAKQAGLTDEDVDQALFSGWREDEIQKVKGTY